MPATARRGRALAEAISPDRLRGVPSRFAATVRPGGEARLAGQALVCGGGLLI